MDEKPTIIGIQSSVYASDVVEDLRYEIDPAKMGDGVSELSVLP
jgi:hypothetical protein